MPLPRMNRFMRACAAAMLARRMMQKGDLKGSQYAGDSRYVIAD